MIPRRDSPRISVVMPFYANGRTLVRSVESFARQHATLPFEVIVVDDEAEGRAEQLLHGRSFPFRCRHLQSERSGQSAATNRGIEAARGDLILLTCADIVASPQLLTVHQKAHEQTHDDIAVQGYIPYAPWLKKTPFMRYLASPGPQFSFETIGDPNHLAPGHIYAPNVSASTRALKQVEGFDESFPYGFQDVDLGHRLVGQGVRLTYQPTAVGFHDHPNDLDTFLARQKKVGAYLPRMMRKNWDAGQRQSSAKRLRDALRSMSQVPDLYTAAKAIESELSRYAGIYKEAEERLFALYTLLSTAYIARGAMDAADELLGMAPELEVDIAEAQRVLTRVLL